MQEVGSSRARDSIILNPRGSQLRDSESHNNSAYEETSKTNLMELITNTKEFSVVPMVHSDINEVEDKDGNIWEGAIVSGVALLSLGIGLGIGKWKRIPRNR